MNPPAPPSAPGPTGAAVPTEPAAAPGPDAPDAPDASPARLAAYVAVVGLVPLFAAAVAMAFLANDAWRNAGAARTAGPPLSAGDTVGNALRAADAARDRLVAGAGVTLLLALIAAAGLVLWSRTTIGRLDTLGRRSGGLRARAAWSWLVPVVHLVVPGLLVAELMRQSHPAPFRSPDDWRSRPVGGDVVVWWIAHIVAALCAALALAADPARHETTIVSFATDADEYRATFVLVMLASVALAVAAVSLMVVLATIERRVRRVEAPLLPD